MFERCYADGEFKQAIGIALEAHRLDVIETSILKGNQKDLLQYVLDAGLTIVQNLELRNKVLSDNAFIIVCLK